MTPHLPAVAKDARWTATVCLYYGTEDMQTGEAEVTCTYGVQWNGQFGPHDIVDIEILTVDGEAWTPAAHWQWCGLTFADATDDLAWKIECDKVDELVEHAIEVEVEVEERRQEAQAERRNWLTESEYDQ